MEVGLTPCGILLLEIGAVVIVGGRAPEVGLETGVLAQQADAPHVVALQESRRTVERELEVGSTDDELRAFDHLRTAVACQCEEALARRREGQLGDGKSWARRRDTRS
jgi:hypothetical protein